MRPLTLHSSALTDSEYNLYTTALLDLAGEDAVSHPSDDSYYASLVVSAREARAWIRGRYTAGGGALSPGQVDGVLKLFCPALAPADTLSGGQFFAAMRLVTHLRHGKPLDGSLVFVQGECGCAMLLLRSSSSLSTTALYGHRPGRHDTRYAQEHDGHSCGSDSFRTRLRYAVPS
ncbi:hypothetical protein PHLGIDRAFT_324748 [Phlebiopsis gigantea 11061_1 CR5-6]|uniref:Uncharacterized protein n=1 Tax=Phlebiopsis gigantea (strain 11061_1 CR5-6) TaxID=745531 RepID=A0A0C3S2J8_PHLG1|nr:hypothetical protein PHLGIDRAFT_324748 [Phlebiopsis gigantea 11061_1 CR5-6]